MRRTSVSLILTRLHLNTDRSLQPRVPIVRYEHPAPGDLLHIDIKELARIAKPGHRLTGNPQDETRGAGWEFLYRSRIAFTALLPNEKGVSASMFLCQTVAYFARLGFTIYRVLTDNGPCFCSRRFRIKPMRTRIYTPRTNGKAERFIQTGRGIRLEYNTTPLFHCLKVLPEFFSLNRHIPLVTSIFAENPSVVIGGAIVKQDHLEMECLLQGGIDSSP